MVHTQRSQHRGVRVLDRGGDFIFTWVFNNTRGSVLMAILLHGTMDVFPNAFLLAHLPGAAEMTSAGVLSMYWGLALGFGLFALLLFTRGRLGKQDGLG